MSQKNISKSGRRKIARVIGRGWRPGLRVRDFLVSPKKSRATAAPVAF